MATVIAVQQFLRDWMPLLNTAIFIGVAKLLWSALKAWNKQTSDILLIQADIAEIKTNHLPHLYEELKSQRQDFINALIEMRK